VVVAALGERLGGGGSSEVYAWDEGRVVKLFLPAYEHAVGREHEVAGAVHRAGVASPEVHGVVEVDGRRGIVFASTARPCSTSSCAASGRRARSAASWPPCTWPSTRPRCRRCPTSGRSRTAPTRTTSGRSPAGVTMT
jgi:hypothetical protein